MTPILSRLLEKLVVHRYFYPIMNLQEHSAQFQDQYAFRPTGSTTAAFINLSQSITDMLQVHPYVHLISLDFSKAFDTVRHSSFTDKLLQFPIPHPIHNWCVHYLSGRQHCTKYNGIISAALHINASFIQGSGIAPVFYDFNSSDLRPVNPLNRLNKYADDIMLLVGADAAPAISQEIDHVNEWATRNNLQLNKAKSKEVIIRRPRVNTGVVEPQPIPGLLRVDQMKILGVTFSNTMTFKAHVDSLVCQSSQSMYALRVLRSHGLDANPLWEVTRATLVARLLYASPAWWGFLDAEGKRRLQATLHKLQRSELLPRDFPTFGELCQLNDQTLFQAVLNNENHVLYHLLPPIKNSNYNLRTRPHNRTIPSADSQQRQKFYYSYALPQYLLVYHSACYFFYFHYFSVVLHLFDIYDICLFSILFSVFLFVC